MSAGRLLGTLLGLAAAVLVGWRLWEQREALTASPRTLAFAALGALIMAAASLLLSEGWRRLLRWHSGAPCAFAPVHHAYATSAIAKYLPGNVLHLVGRHALGRAQQVPHATLLACAVHEAGSLVAVAAGVALAGLALLGGAASAGLVALALPLGVAAALLPPVLALRRERLPGPLARLVHERPEGAPGLRSPDLLAVPLLHLGFFLAGGLVLALLLPEAGLVVLGPALLGFGTAWTLGFLTPGAPAGLGVREAVLVALLTPSAGEPAALTAALAFRAATLGGDLLFYLSARGLGADGVGSRPGRDPRGGP